MVRNTTDTSRLGKWDWQPIPPMPGAAKPQGQPQSQNSGMGNIGNQRSRTKNGFDVTQFLLGLMMTLICHFIGFLMKLPIGLGYGILVGVLFEIWWDYVMSTTMQVWIFQFTIKTFSEGLYPIVNIWLDKIQKKYYMELFYTPRVLYFCGYTAAFVLLFYSYSGTYLIVQNNTTLMSTNCSDPNPEIWSPLRMGQTDEYFHYTVIFVFALCYIVYITTKENDWMTYRKAMIEDGHRDPADSRGSMGSILLTSALYLIAYTFIMLLYTLPLLGCFLIFRQFEFGAKVTYFGESVIAIILGIGATFIERRAPFPAESLRPRNDAYRNHLQIRIEVLQIFMVPLPIASYFISCRTIPINAQNDEFLVFTIGVGLGIVQVVKVFGNDIFIRLHVRRHQGLDCCRSKLESASHSPTTPTIATIQATTGTGYRVHT